MTLIVFDLDGTLALTEHRAHYIRSRPKDWGAFYDACDRDAPNVPIIETYQALEASGFDVQIWTGRTERARGKTVDWLYRHGIWRPTLRMRPEGDHRPDTVVKAEWLAQSPRKPQLVFEDRASVVAMWRAHGIVCAQVAPGDF